MRILLLLHDHPANPRIGGGGAIRMRNINRLLAEKGHEIHWVAGWFPGCEELPPEPGARMTFVGKTPKFRTAAYALAVWVRLRGFAEGVDVIVEEFSPYSPLFSFRIRSVPAVLQIQNRVGKRFLFRHPVAGAALWLVESTYHRLFRNIIVLGDALRRRFSPDAAIIPQGVSSAAFRTPSRRGDYIAFLGRIDFDQKGLDLLLDAAARTGLPVRIAGAGLDVPRLTEALKQLPNVTHVGQLQEPEKFRFLAEARFGVVPSRFEGEAMTLIEIAACGKAAVVSSVPEIAYAVERGFGVSFPSGDAAALAARMRELWDDPARLDEMGARRRAFARDRDWTTIADSFAAYLSATIGTPGR